MGTSAPEAVIDTWFTHIDHLARVIGPRGSTTPGEARASEYAQETFRRYGLDPRVERFTSPVSAWLPFGAAMGLALLSVGMYPLAGRASASVALVLFLVSALAAMREAQLLWSPLRLVVSKRGSQNVWAVVPAAGERRRRVLIVGHIDTQRTPLLFRPGWGRVLYGLVPLGGVAIVALAALMVTGLFVQERVIFLLSLGPTTIVLVMMLLMVQAEATPYTAGANDNATGAALVLTLAKLLRGGPLTHSEVWLLTTGCEEVGCQGAIAFYRAHEAELRDAMVVVVDSVGGPGSGACYLRSEGAPLPRRYDARLLALADTIAVERPDLEARGTRLTMGYSEGLPAIQAGFRALTLWGLTPDGKLPFWHQAEDIVDNIDRAALSKNFGFIQELLHRIDAGAGE